MGEAGGGVDGESGMDEGRLMYLPAKTVNLITVWGKRMNIVFVYTGLKILVAESKCAESNENQSEAADSAEMIAFYVKNVIYICHLETLFVVRVSY